MFDTMVDVEEDIHAKGNNLIVVGCCDRQEKVDAAGVVLSNILVAHHHVVVLAWMAGASAEAMMV